MADDEGRVYRPTNGGGIQLIPPTSFVVPGLGSGSLTWDTQLIRFISTPSWASGALMVRVHGGVALAGTQAFSIVAQKASRSPDEPQSIFSTSIGETVCTVPITATAGLLIVTALNTPIAAGHRILLRTLQNSTLQMSVVISAELDGRVG